MTGVGGRWVRLPPAVTMPPVLGDRCAALAAIFVYDFILAWPKHFLMKLDFLIPSSCSFSVSEHHITSLEVSRLRPIRRKDAARRSRIDEASREQDESQRPAEVTMVLSSLRASNA